MAFHIGILSWVLIFMLSLWAVFLTSPFLNDEDQRVTEIWNKMKHIYTQLYEASYNELIMKENCLLLKLYRKLRKMFLSPRRKSNPQPSGLRWDALTIELPGLRWQREGHDVYWFVRTTHVLLIQQSRYVSISWTVCALKKVRVYRAKTQQINFKQYW